MVEKAPYEVVKKIDALEIRMYPALVLASVTGYDDTDAFGLLFKYISGYNTSRRKVAMTAPVITTEKIAMTAPVISHTNYMAFVMPSLYDESTIPQPKDTEVSIETLPERKVAVLRFRGYTSDKEMSQRMSELFSVLEKYKIQTKGEPFLMRYNSPFAPGIVRRNEVAVEIE